MVLGSRIGVTAVPPVYPCVNTQTMPLGLQLEWPSRRQASVYWLRSRVFMGLPWPKNTTGILDLLDCIGRPLREIEEQDLGVLPFFQRELGGLGGFQGVTGLERLAVHRQAAARHVHVGTPTWLQMVDGAVRTVQKRSVDKGVLVDRHGSLAPVGRGYQPQPPALGRRVEMLLLVARRNAGDAGLHPDLAKVGDVRGVHSVA